MPLRDAMRDEEVSQVMRGQEEERANEGEATRRRYGGCEANAYGRGEWTEHKMTRFPLRGNEGDRPRDRRDGQREWVMRMTGWLRGVRIRYRLYQENTEGESTIERH